MDDDKKIRLIILYNIAAEYNDDDGEAVNNMTHLSSEIASQHIMVSCLDNVVELIEEADADNDTELAAAKSKLVRIGDFFIMGLEIDPMISELPAIYSILSDWDISEEEMDKVQDVQYKVFCANFENTILNGFKFFDEYPAELIPEDFHQPDDMVDEDDELDELGLD